MLLLQVKFNKLSLLSKTSFNWFNILLGFLTAFSALYLPETNGEDMLDNIEETKKFLSKDNSENNQKNTTSL